QSWKYVNLHINRDQDHPQLDAAPDITIILWKLWKSLGLPRLETVSPSAISTRGWPVKLTWELGCNVTYWGINISTTACVADFQLNLLDFKCIRQLGHMDLSINVICYCVHSDASTTSFTAEMMGQCFPRHFKKVLIYVITLRRY
ncbi:unnamed protein product, partial [Hymenolepis diminuta]